MQGHTSSYVITTLVTPPASTGLTSLGAIRDELTFKADDTSNDAWFTNRAIPQASADIARYCNRVFGRSTWQDEFRPQRGVWGEGVRSPNNPLTLAKWPVTAHITGFTGNTYAGLTKIDGLSLSVTQPLGTGGQLISGPGIVAGTTIAFVYATSIQLSQPAIATATAVNLNTGISVVESIAGVDTGLTANIDFELEQGSLQVGDEGISRLYRLNEHGNPRTWPAAKITVVYQAGYSLPNDANPNLPGDLEECCIRLVVNRFRSRGRDPTLMEQSQPGAVGTQRWWIGATPGQKGALPPELEAMADRYRVPVIA